MASSLSQFTRLPPELQYMIWDKFAFGEQERRYQQRQPVPPLRAQAFAQLPRPPLALGITPTPSLRRPLLAVSRAVRAMALERYYPVRLDVWARPPVMPQDTVEWPFEDIPHPERALASLYGEQHYVHQNMRFTQRGSRALGYTLTRGMRYSWHDAPEVKDATKVLHPDAVDMVNETMWTWSTQVRSISADLRKFWSVLRQVRKRLLPQNRFWKHDFQGRRHVWPMRLEDAEVPTVKRGAVYLDPERDVFVNLDRVGKAARDLLPTPIRRAQRFIALSAKEEEGEAGYTKEEPFSPPTSTIDLRHAIRHALTIRPPHRPNSRGPPGPFDMRAQRAYDALLGGSEASCARYAHLYLQHDLFGLATIHRVFLHFTAGGGEEGEGEHVAFLRDLCAGCDLMARDGPWAGRMLGGRLA
ncbi:hypothetical protein PG990_013558 [Apiospora arundinis]